MISINDIANQLAAELALREARIREAGITLARIESDITSAQDEAARVKAACKDAIALFLREQSEYEQLALGANGELAMAKSALEAQRETRAREEQEHVEKVGGLKAKYAALDREERDNIARLVTTRASIKAEIRSLMDKLKELA